MELRRILGIIAGAIGILLVGSLPASAKDLCFTFGSHVFFTSVSIPSKGQCETFSLAAKAALCPWLSCHRLDVLEFERDDGAA